MQNAQHHTTLSSKMLTEHTVSKQLLARSRTQFGRHFIWIINVHAARLISQQAKGDRI